MKSALSLVLLALVSCQQKSGDQSNVASHSEPGTYLAIGDSISFGFSPLVPYTPENIADGKFRGFPELIAEQTGLKLTNAACPGETTSSFIDPTQPDAGCRNFKPSAFPNLKVKYEESQLEFAKKFLRENPRTELVTLTLSGNDLLLVQLECSKEKVPDLCKIAKAGGVTIRAALNIRRIVQELRSTSYSGPIVLVPNYALDYKELIQGLALGLVRYEIKHALFGFKNVHIADSFEAFQSVSHATDGKPCDAGLLIRLADGTCNEHPSEAGAKLLSQTVLENVK